MIGACAFMGQALSPNHDARPEGVPIQFLILHYTGMASGWAARERLCDPKAEVSAHYLIGEDGTVWQLVPEARRAWHAGRSFWRGLRRLNDRSIGIELVNAGHDHGYRPFPPAQLKALAALGREILARHPIPPANVLAHSDIAPDRKRDPGELFPWRWLAREGLGLWPEVRGGESTAEEAPAAAAAAELAQLGYEIEGPGGVEAVLKAFQRHWRPEAISGLADHGTRARLALLIELTT